MKHDIWIKVKIWGHRYGFFVVFGLLSIFIIGSLWSFHPNDPSAFYHTTASANVKNWFGVLGSQCAAWLIYLFGAAAFFLIPILLYSAMFMAFSMSFKKQWDRMLGMLLFFVWMTAFFQVHSLGTFRFSYPGGAFGKYVVKHWLVHFDLFVQKIVVASMLVIATILMSQFVLLFLVDYLMQAVFYLVAQDSFVVKFFRFVWKLLSGVVQSVWSVVVRSWKLISGNVVKQAESSIVEFEQNRQVDQEIEEIMQDIFWDDYLAANKGQAVTQEEEEEFTGFQENFLQENHESIPQEIQSDRTGVVPSAFEDVKKFSLPHVPVMQIQEIDQESQQMKLQDQAVVLEEKLKQFGIEGKVVAMHAGPVVTLFEYKPDIKVKVSRILALEDDLAMALQALSIRIIAPIPGRAVVGFEVANKDRQSVMLDQILKTKEFRKYDGFLPLILGQDTLGNDIIADLAKMPHLLIAGSTGSGKSVALNAMLVSLLCACDPDQLRLIIIDPKRLEFSAYEDIAHLLFPIVTETKKAIPILKWVVQTMEQRYETMAERGVRNILDYQQMAQKNSDWEKMPFMVVIIDELADLMMTAGKAVEDSIARIAQMARAAGIHMIVATQRPSVDVITGMIKVNFPNRISFKVTSKIDSRTILDTSGAEKLLGRGDMLFLDASNSHLVRVHGAYIADEQIHDIVGQIKSQRKVEYLDISTFFAQQEESEMSDGDDDLYQEVLDLLKEIDEVSISLLQRRFRIGYNRSARIIELLESKGLIMPADGGKMRRVVKQ